MNRCLRTVAVIVSALVPVGSAVADDDRESQGRLKLMEQEVAQFTVHAPAGAAPASTRFAAKPVLRYSDPTRGLTEANVLMDATVWRLGEQGRPRAIVMLEIYRSSASEGILSFEFLSLSPDPFTMQHRTEPHILWEATESALTMAPMPGAPEPAATVPARLLQMRQFAKRFAVREKLLKGDLVECRLLTQPIDRYQAADQQIADGALFAFANGTNPEVGLLFESDGKRWTFGLVRLTSAEATVLLDDREVVKFPLSNSFQSRKGSYVSNNHRVRLPQ
ncbi:MAG TPA: hypothetical protein VM165_26045 [Planctomycetaceae bacterium]|nr:hypothetical protein [Planctomycetaceae bacterium]